ncbi:MAG: GTPase Era [Clostridia bacterium]|nr:GTPase Era [Clostridia bacterium]
MKTVFASILGLPNAGKSTLLNRLVGEKISIVSPKPQTTRSRVTGVLTQGETQFVFTDTPGLLKPRNKLGEYMSKVISQTSAGGDVVILVVEPHAEVKATLQRLLQQLKADRVPVVLAVNKVDTVEKAELLPVIGAYAALYDFEAVVPLSAKRGDGVELLLAEMEKLAVEGPWVFEEDALTDQSMRQLASEIIREKLLLALNREVPHGTAVVIESMEERQELIKIGALILCEKASHKGIIIGKGGAMLKRIATQARMEMERLFDCKVFLECFVRVDEQWRDSNRVLNDLGYKIEE